MCTHVCHWTMRVFQLFWCHTAVLSIYVLTIQQYASTVIVPYCYAIHICKQSSNVFHLSWCSSTVPFINVYHQAISSNCRGAIHCTIFTAVPFSAVSHLPVFHHSVQDPMLNQLQTECRKVISSMALNYSHRYDLPAPKLGTRLVIPGPCRRHHAMQLYMTVEGATSSKYITIHLEHAQFQ